MRTLAPTPFQVALSLWAAGVLLAATACSPPWSWKKELPSPAGPRSGEPHLFASRGRVYLSWLEEREKGKTALLFSQWDGGAWATPATVADDRNFFVNWADFPSIIALEDGSLTSHWLEMSGGTRWYDYNVKVSRSKDGGKTWAPALTPHRDGTRSEHGFVSLLPLKGGAFAAVWLDGRKTARSKTAGSESHGHGEQSLYFAVYDGRRFGREELLDPRVCDCCQTSMVETPSGMVVAYRDRSKDEVRDVYYVRRVGGRWTKPKPVHKDNWTISGCPVNGPQLSASGDKVAIAWYTAAEDKSSVLVAFSEDGGDSFADPYRVDQGSPLGRVSIQLLEDGSAVVAWLETREKETFLLVRKVTARGDLGGVREVARSSESRTSGFPRLARSGRELLISWTDAGQGTSQVRMARLRPSQL